ncbi:hypothetical protein CRYUN_Cryun05aG0012900 [Craigia yunnanensis]
MEILRAEKLASVGSALPALMFVWASFKQFYRQTLQTKLQTWWDKLVYLLFPYIQIAFHEYSSGLINRSAAYAAIEGYLCSKSIAQAVRLKAESAKKDQPLVLAMDDYEEVQDEFQGIKVNWYRGQIFPQTKTISWHPTPDWRRYYQLTFPEKHSEIITVTYLKHVMREGKSLKIRRRFRRLYMKNPSDDFWDYAVFQHPSTFDNYALDPRGRSQAKDYNAKIGKVWKRGYLLYGPPGTGKSTMIAAMANLLGYDIYDLELTTIKNNTELKTLLINTTAEDEEENANGESKVTLSGFLNFVDGIWSACEGERIFIFTTNHVDQLDPALIQRGRMDMHIELSYCSFEAFKIKQLLSEVNMTPADVAENLMKLWEEALETAKEEGRVKAKEEARVKTMEEAKENAKAKEEVEVDADE